MKCKDIIKELEKRYPPSLAVEWDNVGLLIGDEEKEVGTILTALDLTDETLEEAIECGANLIVTHHPLLFRPVSKIVRSDFIGRRIMKLIEHGISYYAMHTNFDIAGMADRNAADLGLLDPEVLEVVGECSEEQDCGSGKLEGSENCGSGKLEGSENCGSGKLEGSENCGGGSVYGFGRIGNLAEPVKLSEFAACVKAFYKLDQIRCYGDPEKIIRRAAVSSGSGKSSIPDAIRKGADVIITGDVDYHTAIDAVMQGIAVIDAGHYGTEYVFIDEAADYLAQSCPDCKIVRKRVVQPYSIF